MVTSFGWSLPVAAPDGAESILSKNRYARRLIEWVKLRYPSCHNDAYQSSEKRAIYLFGGVLKVC
jgi:hypothetical protein